MPLLAFLTIAFLAGGSVAPAQTQSFTQPSITSNYLESVRVQRRQLDASRSTAPSLPTTTIGETSSPYYPIPTPPRPDTSSIYGRTQFGFSTTEAALPKAYPTYDSVSAPVLFPTREEVLRRLEPFDAQDRSLEAIDPFTQFEQKQVTNPFRTNLFGGTASEGRFGLVSEDLAPRTGLNLRGLGQRDNIQIGELDMRLGFIAGMDYTDNALFLPVDRTEDIIARAGLRFDARYPFTKKNVLNFAIGVGYERYMLNPEFNDFIRSSGLDLNISPGSRISLDWEIGNVFLTVFDSFSVRQRIQDDLLIQAQDNFAEFFNTIGISADWQVNPSTNFTSSVNRTDSIALNSELSGFDSTSYSVLGDLTYAPRLTWSTGLEGSVSINNRGNTNAFTTFANQNNSRTYTFGAHFATLLSRFTNMRLAGGVQHGAFDVDSAAIAISDDPLATADVPDFTQPYYNISLSNALNRYTNQILRVGRETGLSQLNNFVTADYARYSLNFAFVRTSVSPTFYYEVQEDSGGILAQKIKRRGGGLSVRHQLNRKITIYLGYNYGDLDSELLSGVDLNIPARDPFDPTVIRTVPGSDTTQKTLSVDIAFPFTQKIDLVLGYRRLRAHSNQLVNNFVENRGSINFSYNF